RAPASGGIAPPGDYMLFVVNQQGVPSVAPIIRVGDGASSPPTSVSTPTPAPGTPTLTSTATRTPTPSPGAPVAGSALVGSAEVQPNGDTDMAGSAEAFQYTAAGTGTVGQLSVYVDAASSASRIALGLYADAGGRPGALLT